jgi:hypothetical protein
MVRINIVTLDHGIPHIDLASPVSAFFCVVTCHLFHQMFCVRCPLWFAAPESGPAADLVFTLVAAFDPRGLWAMHQLVFI